MTSAPRSPKIFPVRKPREPVRSSTRYGLNNIIKSLESGVWSLESGVWSPYVKNKSLFAFDSRLSTPDSRLFTVPCGPRLPPIRAYALSRGSHLPARRILMDQLYQSDRQDDESLARSRMARSHQCPCRLQSECLMRSTPSRPQSFVPAAERFGLCRRAVG